MIASCCERSHLPSWRRRARAWRLLAEPSGRSAQHHLHPGRRLGYAELGFYGQEKIRTPHIDRLAAEGMRFTQYYSGERGFARLAMLPADGKHPGHAFIRDNKVPKSETGNSRQQPIRPRNDDRRCSRARYATAAVGKWGAGCGHDGRPNAQGFDLFFGYYSQVHAHSYYPAYLWENGRKVPLDNDPPIPGHAPLPPGPTRATQPPTRPSRARITRRTGLIERATRFIARTASGRSSLFLHDVAPRCAAGSRRGVKPYLGCGRDAVRRRSRLTRPAGAGAAYAAMVSRLDKDVGRLVAVLDELKLTTTRSWCSRLTTAPRT